MFITMFTRPHLLTLTRARWILWALISL